MGKAKRIDIRLIFFTDSSGKEINIFQHKLEIAFYFLDASQKRKSFLALSV